MMNRFTLKPYLLKYVQEQAEQLGTPDLTVAIAFIISQHKLGSCQCRYGLSDDQPFPSADEAIAPPATPSVLDQLLNLPGIN